MRDQLQETGLRVWQQATSIPKDSDNWFTEWWGFQKSFEHPQRTNGQFKLGCFSPCRYPAARAAKRVVCFVNAECVCPSSQCREAQLMQCVCCCSYVKSPYCMKEFIVAVSAPSRALSSAFHKQRQTETFLHSKRTTNCWWLSAKILGRSLRSTRKIFPTRPTRSHISVR